MNRRPIAIALATTVVALGGIVWLTLHEVERQRGEVVAQLAGEDLVALELAAAGFGEDLQSVADHLQYVAALLATAPEASEREIRALVTLRREYRGAAFFDAAGVSQLEVVDEQHGTPADLGPFRGAMERAAKRVLKEPVGKLYVSPALPEDPRGWGRTFAVLVGPGGAPRGVFVLLVDTGPFTRNLQPLHVEPVSKLVVIGGYGKVTPATSVALRAALRDLGPRYPGLTNLVDEMQRGHRGTLRIDEREAQRLGLPAAEAIAAHTPVILRGMSNWSVALIKSTSAFRRHERGVMARLLLIGSVSGGLLAGLAAYAIVALRRRELIRERLRQAERLAHLHEKSEKVLDNIPAGVLVLDEGQRLASLNRAARQLVPEGLIGRPWPEAFPRAAPEVIAGVQRLLDEVLVRGEARTELGEPAALLGPEGRYSVHLVPLEPRFPEARSLLVVEDLSAVERLERQLLRAEKLATVGVLAAGIAHEIGTPLGIVRGRAEYILGKLGGDHPQARGLSTIVEQIDRVSRVLGQLLDFSRLRPALARPVDLAAVAHAVVELLRFEAQRGKVELAVEVPGGLPPLRADSDQLQQVLVNLSINGCDACEADGHVTIAARRDDDPRYVRIEVRDDGCGIPAELRDRVFDPFFTTKKRGKGTGLGLAVCAEIVRNHGGEIELDSNAGRGTIVGLRWPVAPESA